LRQPNINPPNLDTVLPLLSDASRRKIMTFLQESKASHDLEIAKATGLSPEAVSKTIGELLEGGLIELMPLSKATFYTLTPLGRDVVRKYL